VSLAQTLRFDQTAAFLGIAESSVSEAIGRLEAKLDVVLLERRTSGGVILTEAGTGLLPGARTILLGLAAAKVPVPIPSGVPTS
jgi:DNA-binding transcriptional LysR family regulator